MLKLSILLLFTATVAYSSEWLLNSRLDRFTGERSCLVYERSRDFIVTPSKIGPHILIILPQEANREVERANADVAARCRSASAGAALCQYRNSSTLYAEYIIDNQSVEESLSIFYDKAAIAQEILSFLVPLPPVSNLVRIEYRVMLRDNYGDGSEGSYDENLQEVYRGFANLSDLDLAISLVDSCKN